MQTPVTVHKTYYNLHYIFKQLKIQMFSNLTKTSIERSILSHELF